MAYIINKYDGTQLTVLEDGTINTTTSINLIGRNYFGYGEQQNENFLFLLENFANNVPPLRPIKGQLWYDTSTNALNVYDGVEWNLVNSANVSSNTPATTVTGALWLKSPENVLYAYTGSEWAFIGPEATPGFGTTRSESTTLLGLDSVVRPVIMFKVNDRVIAIASEVDFVIHPTVVIPGFSSLVAGLTISSELKIKGTLEGNASTSTKLATSRTINGVGFDGTANIDIKATTTNRLTPGQHISGDFFDGSSPEIWNVISDSNATPNTLVSRNSQGEFSAVRVLADTLGIHQGNVIVDDGVSIFNVVQANQFDGPFFTGNSFTASNLAGGNKGSIPYQLGNNSTAFLPIGPENTFLQSSANGTVAWVAITNENLSKGLYLNFVSGLGPESTYNGTKQVTVSVDADSANTPNKVVARDLNGDFSARTITANLIGNATSSDKVNNSLIIGSYLKGANFDGSAVSTIEVDASSINVPNKVVLRDTSGNFSANRITLDGVPVETKHAITKGYIDDLEKSSSRVKAWVKFRGASGVILKSYNVTSVTKTAPGRYTINILPGVFSNNHYAVAGMASDLDHYVSTASEYIGGSSSSTQLFISVVDKGDGNNITSDAAEVSVMMVGTPFSNTDQDIVEVTGQAQFTTPGTYSWTVPANLNFISAVAIGGGGGGGPQVSTGGSGGGGGACAYANDITVTPGETLTVVVGAGGGSGVSGGNTSLIRGSTTILRAGGGVGGNGNGVSAGGGTFSHTASAITGTFGGWNGGIGGAGGPSSGQIGGNGAGSGYIGSAGGGSGGHNGGPNEKNGGNGAVGAIGGGAGAINTRHSGAGGGGGTLSQGYPGFAGSIGDGSLGGVGGRYGGGAGGASHSGPGGVGAAGALRIIWGNFRQFPGLNTQDI